MNDVKTQGIPSPTHFACERGGRHANSVEREEIPPPAHSCRTHEEHANSIKTEGIPPPAYSCMRGRWRTHERHREAGNTSFAHEGEGGCVNGVKREEIPAPACFCVRRRWKTCEGHQEGGNTTSGLLLHVREVEDARTALKWRKFQLRLALACEGGGGCANGIEREEIPPPARYYMRGRWRMREQRRKGGNSISVSLLHAREVEET